MYSLCNKSIKKTVKARKTDQKNITYLQETGVEILIRTYLMRNDIMQCGKCVRNLLRNLMLLSSGRMSHTLTMIMKATRSTETPVHMHWTTWGHIPGDSNPHSQNRANLESGTHNF